MKIGFIGCVRSSEIALKMLLSPKIQGVEVVAVITKEKSNFNSDHVDLGPLCKQYAVPCHSEESQQKIESLRFMEQYRPDVVYCIGWSNLLDNEFLKMPPLGVIGFHPAKLPQNRGRHPIIWALVLGLDSTASTFFKMAEGADTGAILSQVNIAITKDDDAASLYENILIAMRAQVPQFTEKLRDGTVEYTEQDPGASNMWRKRTRVDGLIDWRMQAEDIYNLVRALTKPYPGAEMRHMEVVVPIWKCEVSGTKYPRNIEPGYVLSIDGLNLLIKCGGSTAVWLVNPRIQKLPKVGDYL